MNIIEKREKRPTWDSNPQPCDNLLSFRRSRTRYPNCASWSEKEPKSYAPGWVRTIDLAVIWSNLFNSRTL